MKIHYILLIILLCFTPKLFADDTNELPVDGSLTDLTGDDPYYYTKDQIIDEDNAQKNLSLIHI